ncbi:FUSC family protein [Streptomyces sp. NPDC088354]|uniref:FUSC family protein n=1 Tax=unclassified Streptomyces TaxID=2593676 RepID=UPI0029AEAFBD|nr:FUSC family protein [Streptomyces sp. MI02-7b]MDX3071531.1 FUSC family protein [Streptomyces sp. MI02-7b]
MFHAPDPGRVRLRAASRAVLGVGSAVASVAAAGLPLPAVVAGGLAALLALFVVADPGPARQAVTTALMPVAGFPVLALAVWLHAVPAARDAAFLAVVFAGVYARRWGPRGHALGVFAFMMFFVAQFLRAGPALLPALCGAVGLGLGSAALVRFGVWCYERGAARAPGPVPVLPQGRGLRRPTTRQAFQALLAAGIAVAAGQALSQDRWYWAVGTVWWIFVNTASRGETLIRGFRRMLGTVAGILGGLAVALPLHGAPAPTAALLAVCVFGIFWTAPVSYSWMMFFVTVMAGLLYGLLGILRPGLLVLRLGETAVGALGAAVAVLAVLPVTTHAATDAWIRRTLRAVRDFTGEAARHLAGDPAGDLARHVTELDALLARVRQSVAPLVHPLNPLRSRKARARVVLALLDECARQVRGLAAVVADPHACHDERLTTACGRVETAVRRLVPPAPAAPLRLPAAPGAGGTHPHAETALAHLHGLEAALTGLAVPLGAGPRTTVPVDPPGADASTRTAVAG